MLPAVVPTFVPSSLLGAFLYLALLATVLWLCAVATIWSRQERLLFRPDARLLGEVPSDLAALRFRAAQLTTRDGLGLLFWAADPLPGRPTLLLFHGNAGNAADRAPLLAPFAAAGYGVVLAEYRGYAGNPGSPSELGLLQDGRAYLEWVATAWQETAPILCGESIGTGVAVRMAMEQPVRAVVLDAPYTSVADLAASIYRWLPARSLLRHPFDSLSCLPLVQAPLLVVHGEADDLIPPEHGRRVAAAAGGSAEFVLLPGVGHPALGSDPAGLGLAAVQRFLAQVSPAANAKAGS